MGMVVVVGSDRKREGRGRADRQRRRVAVCDSVRYFLIVKYLHHDSRLVVPPLQRRETKS